MQANLEQQSPRENVTLKVFKASPRASAAPTPNSMLPLHTQNFKFECVVTDQSAEGTPRRNTKALNYGLRSMRVPQQNIDQDTPMLGSSHTKGMITGQFVPRNRILKQKSPPKGINLSVPKVRYQQEENEGIQQKDTCRNVVQESGQIINKRNESNSFAATFFYRRQFGPDITGGTLHHVLAAPNLPQEKYLQVSRSFDGESATLGNTSSRHRLSSVFNSPEAQTLKSIASRNKLLTTDELNTIYKTSAQINLQRKKGDPYVQKLVYELNRKLQNFKITDYNSQQKQSGPSKRTSSRGLIQQMLHNDSKMSTSSIKPQVSMTNEKITKETQFSNSNANNISGFQLQQGQQQTYYQNQLQAASYPTLKFGVLYNHNPNNQSASNFKQETEKTPKINAGSSSHRTILTKPQSIASLNYFSPERVHKLIEMCWHRISYSDDTTVPDPRASQTLVQTYDETNQNIVQLYFPTSENCQKGSFFMFGGGNLYQFYNDVYSYSIEERRWSLIECIGEPPAPRAGHTSTRIDDVHFCVIGGGTPVTVFNDIYLFNITKATWVRVNANGDYPERRCGHSATLTDSKILVFGGGDVDGQIFGDVQSLDLIYMESNQKKIFQSASGSIGPEKVDHESTGKESDSSLNTSSNFSRSSRRRLKKQKFALDGALPKVEYHSLKDPSQLIILEQQQHQKQKIAPTPQIAEIHSMKQHLKEQHDMFTTQFKLMSSLISNMQIKSDQLFSYGQKNNSKMKIREYVPLKCIVALSVTDVFVHLLNSKSLKEIDIDKMDNAVSQEEERQQQEQSNAIGTNYNSTKTQIPYSQFLAGPYTSHLERLEKSLTLPDQHTSDQTQSYSMQNDAMESSNIDDRSYSDLSVNMSEYSNNTAPLAKSPSSASINNEQVQNNSQPMQQLH